MAESFKRRSSKTPEKPPAKRINTSQQSKTVPSLSTSDLRTAVLKTVKDSSVLLELSQLILDSVIDVLEPKIKDAVDDSVKAEVESMHETLSRKDEEISDLKKRLLRLEKRAEEQEQYSRRNCLRFSNIPYVTNEGTTPQSIGEIDTDAIVLDICNKSLGTNVTLDDISRSHVVGTPRNGKCQIIARFNSYRKRHMVYSAKSKMKSDSELRFICEDLTRSRFKIVQHLAGLRKAKKISQFWTLDGRIFMRISEGGYKILIKSMEDIHSHLAYGDDTDEDDPQRDGDDLVG
ncbi:hypothetical protein FSP39_015424 [Pinctada imbricata]|uniref:Uncharacterized protein n=1 Tax=Pinctada imbricata TaxID=66713 RepID=A0AA88XPD3_PINIB|nr:hypothetical protein FSP39_015424 [Pinctada imbricata]